MPQHVLQYIFNTESSDLRLEERNLKQLLEARLAEAAWVWPDIQNKSSEFVDYIVERLPESDEPAQAVERLKVSTSISLWVRR